MLEIRGPLTERSPHSVGNTVQRRRTSLSWAQEQEKAQLLLTGNWFLGRRNFMKKSELATQKMPPQDREGEKKERYFLAGSQEEAARWEIGSGSPDCGKRVSVSAGRGLEGVGLSSP